MIEFLLAVIAMGLMICMVVAGFLLCLLTQRGQSRTPITQDIDDIISRYVGDYQHIADLVDRKKK